ncbi:MAG: phage holin family protein [Minisyncoccia bacterium]
MKFLKRFILAVILNVIALFCCEKVLGYFGLGFYLDNDLKRVIIFAIILASVNFLVKPILKLLFLPLIWITLGLFSLVINIFVLKIANHLYPTITIESFSGWLISSLIISFFNYLSYL